MPATDEPSDLATSREWVDRASTRVFELGMVSSDNASREQRRRAKAEMEQAIDDLQWARMDYDREFAKVFKPCPSRLSVAGAVRDLR